MNDPSITLDKCYFLTYWILGSTLKCFKGLWYNYFEVQTNKKIIEPMNKILKI
jgi:hypothetical protein